MPVRTPVSLPLPVSFAMNVRPMPCTDTERNLSFAPLRAVNEESLVVAFPDTGTSVTT
jgi:hypothetical protein